MNRKVKSILFTNGIRDFNDITILGIKNNFLEILKNDELLKFNISGRDEEEIRLEQEFDEIVESDNDFWDDSTITGDDDSDLDDLDLDNDIDLDELIVEEDEIVVEKKLEFEDEIIEEKEKTEKPKGGRPKKNKNDNLIDIL